MHKTFCFLVEGAEWSTPRDCLCGVSWEKVRPEDHPQANVGQPRGQPQANKAV